MQNQNGIKYVGFFVDRFALDDILQQIRGDNGLCRSIQCPHITTEYRPVEINPNLFGSSVSVVIDGYGKNETNEGFRVCLQSDDPSVQAEIDKIAQKGSIPHITTSVSEDGKPVNTRYLDFESIEPVVIEGTFGGFVSNERVLLDRADLVSNRRLPSMPDVVAIDNQAGLVE